MHGAPARNDDRGAAVEQHVDAVGRATKRGEVVQAGLRRRVLATKQQNSSYKNSSGSRGVTGRHNDGHIADWVDLYPVGNNVRHRQTVPKINLGVVEAREAEAVQRHGHRFDAVELAGTEGGAVENLDEFDLGGWNKSDEVLDGGVCASWRRRDTEVQKIGSDLQHIGWLLRQIPAKIGLVPVAAQCGDESSEQ